VVEEAIVAAAAKQPVAAVMRAAAGKSALTAAVRLTTTYRRTILAARVPVQVMQLLQIVAADIPAVAAAVDMPAAVVVDIGNL
jgi:hypothetical protein